MKTTEELVREATDATVIVETDSSEILSLMESPRQYRKKINIEVIDRTDVGDYLVRNVGSETDTWVIEREVFESTYERADEEINFIERLKIETKKLIDKADKLHSFKKTVTFYKLSRQEKDLLYKQSRIMDEYIQILGQRMELLGIKDFIKDKE